MLVGAYRGAMRKPFYDLVYFARRLPHQQQEKVQDFVRMIGQEYATTAAPGPPPVNRRAGARATTTQRLKKLFRVRK